MSASDEPRPTASSGGERANLLGPLHLPNSDSDALLSPDMPMSIGLAEHSSTDEQDGFFRVHGGLAAVPDSSLSAVPDAFGSGSGVDVASHVHTTGSPRFPPVPLSASVSGSALAAPAAAMDTSNDERSSFQQAPLSAAFVHSASMPQAQFSSPTFASGSAVGLQAGQTLLPSAAPGLSSHPFVPEQPAVSLPLPAAAVLQSPGSSLSATALTACFGAFIDPLFAHSSLEETADRSEELLRCRFDCLCRDRDKRVCLNCRKAELLVRDKRTVVTTRRACAVLSSTVVKNVYHTECAIGEHRFVARVFERPQTTAVADGDEEVVVLLPDEKTADSVASLLHASPPQPGAFRFCSPHHAFHPASWFLPSQKTCMFRNTVSKVQWPVAESKSVLSSADCVISVQYPSNAGVSKAAAHLFQISITYSGCAPITLAAKPDSDEGPGFCVHRQQRTLDIRCPPPPASARSDGLLAESQSAAGVTGVLRVIWKKKEVLGWQIVYASMQRSSDQLSAPPGARDQTSSEDDQGKRRQRELDQQMTAAQPERKSTKRAAPAEPATGSSNKRGRQRDGGDDQAQEHTVAVEMASAPANGHDAVKAKPANAVVVQVAPDQNQLMEMQLMPHELTRAEAWSLFKSAAGIVAQMVCWTLFSTLFIIPAAWLNVTLVPPNFQNGYISNADWDAQSKATQWGVVVMRQVQYAVLNTVPVAGVITLFAATQPVSWTIIFVNVLVAWILLPLSAALGNLAGAYNSDLFNWDFYVVLMLLAFYCYYATAPSLVPAGRAKRCRVASIMFSVALTTTIGCFVLLGVAFPLFLVLDSVGQALLTALGTPLMDVLFCCIVRLCCYSLVRMDMPREHRDRLWVLNGVINSGFAVFMRLMVANEASIALQALTSALAGIVEIGSRATLLWRDRLLYRMTVCSCSRTRTTAAAPSALPNQASSAPGNQPMQAFVEPTSTTGLPLADPALRLYRTDFIIAAMICEYIATAAAVVIFAIAQIAVLPNITMSTGLILANSIASLVVQLAILSIVDIVCMVLESRVGYPVVGRWKENWHPVKNWRSFVYLVFLTFGFVNADARSVIDFFLGSDTFAANFG